MFDKKWSMSPNLNFRIYEQGGFNMGEVEELNRRIDRVESEMEGLGGEMGKSIVFPVAATILLFIMFHRVFIWVAGAWISNPYFSHGFVLFAVAIGLIAWKRKKIFSVSKRNFVLLPFGIVAFAGGFILHSAEVMAVAFIISAIGYFAAFFGIRSAKAAAFPIGYLLLGIPFSFILPFGNFLQAASARLATGIVGLFGTKAVCENTTITAEGMRFEVALACSGLSSVIAILALVVLLAYILRSNLWKRLLMVGFALPLSLFANAGRIAITIWVALRWGPERALGFFHNASGVVLFLIALGLTAALGFALGAFKTNAKRGIDG